MFANQMKHEITRVLTKITEERINVQTTYIVCDLLIIFIFFGFSNKIIAYQF